MSDILLLWIVVALLTASSVLRILLAEKKGAPLPLIWSVQAFVFPAVLLAAVLLLQLGKSNHVTGAIFFGLIEELVCWLLRRKKK